MKFLKFTLLALVSATLWGGLVFSALDSGWGHPPIIETQDATEFAVASRELAEGSSYGNVSYILLEGGEVAGSFALSKDAPVDDQSVFQVASLGKWLTAWGVMTLVEDGTIDLDTPVSQYISRWKLPASEFDASGVTVRRLLSHTAGLTDRLGYDGFDGPTDLQTLEDSLTKAADASPGKDGMTVIGREPGSDWQYSGGGYTLLQLMIEDVSGQPFPDFMRDRVFNPLGMKRTTFDHATALELGMAQNLDSDGNAEPFRWYTALAATSLFTTSDDLSTFIAAQAPGALNPVLAEDTMALMRKAHASQMGADIWGLGVMLYAPNNSGEFIIGHDGSNEPAINTAARFDPATGDGIVVLSTGNPLLATELAGEWVFWKTGKVDSLAFAARLPGALAVLAGGIVFILATAALAYWRQGRQTTRREEDY